jgi:flagellar biogenesis protein FliO
MEFAVRYAVALGVVALLLVGLSAATRFYTRGRLRPAGVRKTIEVLESAALTQQTSVHLVSVGGRRYLVATAGTAVALLAKLPRDRAA